jgi:hypothetical protein
MAHYRVAGFVNAIHNTIQLMSPIENDQRMQIGAEKMGTTEIK